MRDFASCFSEHALRVSDTSCSGGRSTAPSVQNAVVSVYRVSLSSGKHLLVTLTWSRSAAAHSHDLAVAFNGDASAAFRLTTNSRRLFRKPPRGSKSIQFQNHAIELSWDLSSARYGPGPEPIDGFHVTITVDSELGPTIGDLQTAKPGGTVAKSTLISRQEHFSGGRAACGTRARFRDAGPNHEVSIRCDGDGGEQPAMSVRIGERTAARVKRLRWNFRGKKTIFVDGAEVDLMWDVHDWFYDPVGPGHAVFMFRTTREETERKDQDNKPIDFSFIIFACKNV